VWFKGKPSWCFTDSADQMPHVALFVRDAVGLDVEAAPDIPPALADPVPDLRSVVEPQVRARAGVQWPSWWHALVDAEALMHGDTSEGDDLDDRFRFAEREAAGMPPDFAGLADRPELRQVVLATYEKAVRWTEGRHQAVGRPDVGHTFDWKIVRDVAQDVARDREVSIGDVRGTALVFAVEGEWWARFDAGVVLCSDSIRSDPNAVRAIVRTAFESGLPA
jgi:hypothetical protein